MNKNTNQIIKAFKNLGITINTMVFQQAYNACHYYLLNETQMLKLSKSSLDGHKKQTTIQSLPLVPRIYASGQIDISKEQYHYLITDYLQGTDLWEILPNLANEQKYQIGKEIAKFLTELHQTKGETYDIGHYIPTIGNYKGTWKNGHLEYIESLKKDLAEIPLELESKTVISKAFDYIKQNIHTLDYQMGARRLHNDFHPKNIIVNEGDITGIIDWECSQFGEPDFELAHLFHWCIYPTTPGHDLKMVLKGVVEYLPAFLNIPHIEKRLTIYQLEHELNQLIWHGKNQEEERINRLNGWLDGQINDLMKKWLQ